MIGYFYTSEANYEKIKIDGLVPPEIDYEGVLEICSGTVGNWLLKARQNGAQLLGILLDQFAANRSWESVELEIEFTEEDCLKRLDSGDSIELLKTVGFRGWIYHNDETYVLVSQTILPSRITLLSTFDLHNALEPTTISRS